jgi:hypothetical protein
MIKSYCINVLKKEKILIAHENPVIGENPNPRHILLIERCINIEPFHEFVTCIKTIIRKIGYFWNTRIYYNNW